jgi:hypothetical protein
VAPLIPSSFRQHLAGDKSDSEIASLIISTTTSFNDLSRRINRCEDILKEDLNRTDLADMIRRIQQFEKAKFEAVLFTVLRIANLDRSSTDVGETGGRKRFLGGHSRS